MGILRIIRQTSIGLCLLLMAIVQPSAKQVMENTEVQAQIRLFSA
jgi:hypothetical protein